MTSANKNKAGGHSHPQKNKKSSKHQGDPRKNDDEKSAKGKDVDAKKGTATGGTESSV